MPPRTTFDRKVVLDTAFRILRKEGWKGVSARSIARHLKASTMPVYSSIGSMKKLESALRHMVYERLADYQSRRYTQNVLLNIAVGQVVFARDEPMLYRFLHLDRPVKLSTREQKVMTTILADRLGGSIPYTEFLGTLSTAKLNAISLKAWIFTHGMAMGLMSHSLPSMSDEKIVALLEQAGGAFMLWEERTTST
jgi:AcrR family transcriptional regulator